VCELELILTNVYMFLERCRKSNNEWLRALMQSDCLYWSLFFEQYNRILLCDWVPVHSSVCLMDSVSCHNAFVLCFTWARPVLEWTSSSAVVLHQCHWLANNSVKYVSVISWFRLQRRSKTFC